MTLGVGVLRDAEVADDVGEAEVVALPVEVAVVVVCVLVEPPAESPDEPQAARLPTVRSAAVSVIVRFKVVPRYDVTDRGSPPRVGALGTDHQNLPRTGHRARLLIHRAILSV